MEVKVSHTYPSDIALWDELCLKNSNLVQSTHFDKVQEFYKQKPIYFEVWVDAKLVAGVKMYFWQSEKNFLTRMISKRLSQFGEIVYSEEENREWIIELLQNKVIDYLKFNKIVTYVANGFYGGEDLLIALRIKAKKESRFKIAFVNLDEEEEVLWSKVHSKHRNVIRKAIKNNVSFGSSQDFNSFYSCLESTYDNQEKKPPNREYLLHRYMISKKDIEIYNSLWNSQLLSGAWVTIYGSSAYYEFGGSFPNSMGAGNYLQWEIIKELKDRKIQKYYFGQIAFDFDSANLKFSEGISKFKIRFGVSSADSYKKTYTLKRIEYALWNALSLVSTLVFKRNNS